MPGIDLCTPPDSGLRHASETNRTSQKRNEPVEEGQQNFVISGYIPFIDCLHCPTPRIYPTNSCRALWSPQLQKYLQCPRLTGLSLYYLDSLIFKRNTTRTRHAPSFLPPRPRLASTLCLSRNLPRVPTELLMRFDPIGRVKTAKSLLLSSTQMHCCTWHCLQA